MSELEKGKIYVTTAELSTGLSETEPPPSLSLLTLQYSITDNVLMP